MKSYFLMAAIAFLSNWQCSKPQSMNNVEPTKPIQELPQTLYDAGSYLALGDSYTIGESVGEKERYPNQLADSLAKIGIKLSPVRIIAKTGWTTDELQKAMDTQLDTNAGFNLVSLLIGVNNQYRGRPLDVYKKDFKNLLEQAIRLAKGDKKRVFIVSIPDYAYTPFGGGNAAVSKGIDQFNAENEAIAKEMGIQYVNITPISREGLKRPSLVAKDGLHPSGEQYGQWVSLILPFVKSMVK